jgi:hypothetical protein
MPSGTNSKASSALLIYNIEERRDHIVGSEAAVQRTDELMLESHWQPYQSIWNWVGSYTYSPNTLSFTYPSGTQLLQILTAPTHRAGIHVVHNDEAGYTLQGT